MSPLDRWFGGKPGAAAKVRASLVKQHGAKDGARIFQAMVADRQKSGTGLRKSMAEHKRTRGRFKPKPKGPSKGLVGAMAARRSEPAVPPKGDSSDPWKRRKR